MKIVSCATFFMTGTITTIQRMSVHDGPGIRSVVFLKGCNLRCRWCHNPETWKRAPQLQRIASRCIRCCTCAAVCPQGAISTEDGMPVIDYSACASCGICAEACPSMSLSIVGKEISTDELWQQISKDIPYFRNSGGGVTVSGGEPLLQNAFAAELLQKCKEEGLNTVVQTNATLPWEMFSPLLPYTDLWMCDFKIADSTKHSIWTGSGNENVLSNISRLVADGKQVIVRTPVIPGVNDSAEEIEAICKLLEPLSESIKYELLGFHTLGFGKFDNLGMNNPLSEAEPLKSDILASLKEIPHKYKL